MPVPDFPKRIEIELSSICNLRCDYCPRRYLPEAGGFIAKALYKKIIDEASLYPETIVVLHRRGESMLHPEFNELLFYVAGKFSEVQMATNATMLDENKFSAITGALSFISFSIDTPHVFQRVRKPAHYSEVESNILRFLNFNKGRIKTQVSMVKTATTTDAEINLFKTIWSDKVDRVRIYEEHSINGIFGSLKNPRLNRKPCIMPVYELLVYWDGSVGRCNHDWTGAAMGDLRQNTIKEVWRNAKYNDLRKQHASLHIVDDTCSKCDSWYPAIGVQGTGEVVER